MNLEELTPLQRRRFTLRLMEQVEYALAMDGDMQRSFDLESLEGLHPFSGRDRYLGVLEGAEESSAQAMQKLLEDGDEGWVENADRLIQALQSILPPSQAVLQEEYFRMKLRLG
jgi:hypothetical protein